MENNPKDKAPGRKMAGMPFIMPDGRPLSVFLTESNLMTPHSRRSSKRTGPGKEPSSGWSSSTSRSAAKGTLSNPARELTEAEIAELAALERVGQRRQRRWLNDKLLRDMAPALTAKDMESLFKPAPFGDTGHVSAFTLAAAPEHAMLWDLFRSVDSDKQTRVLQKWETHVQELRASVSGKPDLGAQGNAALSAATAALHGWANISPRGRKALRRAPRGCVEELEGPLLHFMASHDQTEMVLELEDSFLRLLMHALAEFHSMTSLSRNAAGGGREVVLRKRRVAVAEDADKDGSSGADVLACPIITCVDVLWLLEDGEHVGGLTTKTLQEVLIRHDHPPVLDMEHHSSPVVVCAS